MKPSIISYTILLFTILLITKASSATGTTKYRAKPQQDNFIGNLVSLSVDTPKIGDIVGGPFEAIVDDKIEFGPYGSSKGFNVVPVNIDISANTIVFHYMTSGIFAANTTFNGYVFSDVNNTIPTIIDVSIDKGATTLKLDKKRINYTENQIFVNIDGLHYEPNKIIKLYVSFASRKK